MYQKIIPYTSALPNRLCYENLMKGYTGWRFMLSPASIRSFGKNREHMLYDHGFALDNGAYSYHKRELPFPTDIFNKCLDKYGEKADWIVLPDVIEDWERTQEFSSLWYDKMKDINKCLIVAQNGAENNDWKELDDWIAKGVGVFVGGDDDFKSLHTQTIINKCIQNDVICHIGRVNSSKRALWCDSMNAYSFDGSGMARFQRQAYTVSQTMKNIHNQINLFASSHTQYYRRMQLKYRMKPYDLTTQ
jgi:hypothetical protein